MSVYVIASGKGGTGKTMLTANLGAALALQNKRVAVLDGDIGLRNLDMALGLENRIMFDFFDVLEGRCTLDAALLRHPSLHSLYLLPAPQNRQSSDMPDGAIAQICRQLKESFDFVLIDAPAGIGRGFWLCRQAAEGVIAVTLPQSAALRDCDRLLRLARNACPPTIEGTYGFCSRVFVVLNRTQKKIMRKGLQQSTKDAEVVIGTSFSAVIPEDIMASRAHDGIPAVVRYASPAGREIRKLAQEIIRHEGAEVLPQ